MQFGTAEMEAEPELASISPGFSTLLYDPAFSRSPRRIVHERTMTMTMRGRHVNSRSNQTTISINNKVVTEVTFLYRSVYILHIQTIKVLFHSTNRRHCLPSQSHTMAPEIPEKMRAVVFKGDFNVRQPSIFVARSLPLEKGRRSHGSPSHLIETPTDLSSL